MFEVRSKDKFNLSGSGHSIKPGKVGKADQNWVFTTYLVAAEKNLKNKKYEVFYTYLPT